MPEHRTFAPIPRRVEITENEKATIGSLVDFNMEYFKTLTGTGDWLAIGQDDYKNQKYFTVLSPTGDKLGIIGVYDTNDEQNITHTVVDDKYRGQGLAKKFKDALMDKLDLPFTTLTIDLNNEASIRAAEKLPNVQKVSDTQYEQNYHKVKYLYLKQTKQ